MTKPEPQVAIKRIQRIFNKRGSKALKMARKAVLEEKLESKKAQQALNYFMTEYWHDVARPSLMALACEAAGGNPELTLPIAVPMILISGAIDIHDDIIDQSRTKDGKPTVYGKFGKEIALLTGDALLFKGLALLSQAKAEGISAAKMQQITDVTRTMFFELGDAEALELEWIGRLDIKPEDYIRIVRKKAADVEAHTHISAILANASRNETRALSEYGRLLGTMIILRDDLIDLMVPQECRSRIKRECLPLPLLYGLQDPALGPRLKAKLQSKTISDKDTQEIMELLHNSKAIRSFEKDMRALAAKAESKLKTLRGNTQILLLLIEAMLPVIE